MGCSFCGKEIGPIQTLRDDEFCCPGHRKDFHARIAKGMEILARPMAPPRGAGVRVSLLAAERRPRYAFVSKTYGDLPRRLELAGIWPIQIPPVMGTHPKPLVSLPLPPAAQAPAPAGAGRPMSASRPWIPTPRLSLQPEAPAP